MGVEPSEALVAQHATILRSSNWEIQPVLRSLFTSAEFYDSNVISGSILSPVEYIVSLCRRLGETPPGPLLSLATRQLGQDLFEPPNVKGWEGGTTWITTSTMMARGNFAGYLIEGVNAQILARDFAPEPSEPMETMEMSPRPQARSPQRMAPRELTRGLGRGGFTPTSRIQTLVKDAKSVEETIDILCNHFLWVDITAEARASLTSLLSEQVESDSRETYQRPSERRLKRILRILLSLPEAQIG
jgi:hypothetical protein